jgi:hypothetical protein
MRFPFGENPFQGSRNDVISRKAEFAAGSSSIDKKKDAQAIYPTADLDQTTVGNSNVDRTTLSNWYKQKPYAFEFGDDKKKRTFYLPISPSNLNIVTHFATNVISTMYATVEEHSEQRYFDITIAGTTGMSPRYFKEIDIQKAEHSSSKDVGRLGLAVKTSLIDSNALGGFFKRTIDLINNTVDQALEVFKGKPDPAVGVDLRKTGYVAFHNFYKFLLSHKKLAAGETKTFKNEKIKYKSNVKTLRFVNYKDNNMYDVAIQNFTLTRSADNPMLYNYNITMRGYNLRGVDDSKISLDIAERSAELGLDGIEGSFFAKMANKARAAKNAGYSAIAAARGFGS